MNPHERKSVAADIAGIVARGYDMHVDAHGPDDSHAIRDSTGSKYHVDQRADCSVSYIVRDGEIFEIAVTGTGVRS